MTARRLGAGGAPAAGHSLVCEPGTRRPIRYDPAGKALPSGWPGRVKCRCGATSERVSTDFSAGQWMRDHRLAARQAR